MIAKTCSFIAALIALPVIEQLPAVSTVERLGKGTAQVVLAVVVITLALALVRLYTIQRKDWQKRFKELQDERREMQDVVAKNTAALVTQSTSNDHLQQALFALRDVMMKSVP